MKFTNLVDPSLVIITLYLFRLKQSVEKKILFKKYINFTLFTPKLHPPWVGGQLQFLLSLPDRCYIPNLERIGTVVLEKKILTHDDGRQHIAIGHLSYFYFLLIRFASPKKPTRQKDVSNRSVFVLRQIKCCLNTETSPSRMNKQIALL